MAQAQSMNLNFIIDQVAKDKGLTREVFINSLEQAILQTARKTFGSDRNLEARYNEDKGAVELFQAITIVDAYSEPPLDVNEYLLSAAQEKGLDVAVGDELVFQIFYLESDADQAEAQDEQYGDILKLKTARLSFGRIAALAVRQAITQKTRDAERESVYNEYADRKGHLVSGIVRRLERGNLMIDLDQAEAVMPAREQAGRENFRAGDRIVAYVLDVLKDSKGPQIVLSRASSHFLEELFTREVPEIADGTVTIQAVAREPGGRSKIAVSSSDPDVDPVGACVGIRGSRVQAVVQELRNEKVDIVLWDDDAATLACAALAPAEVNRVVVDEENRKMEIVVADDQLSLAIGRRGQNVRLASQLTGWKLDINCESRVREMREFASASMGALPHMTSEIVETLYTHGFRMAVDVAEAQSELLAQIPGINVEWVAELKEAAKVQAEKDIAEQIRRNEERENARQAEARRHPDELTPEERMKRVRGINDKVYEQLTVAGFKTVEEIVALQDRDMSHLSEKTHLGIKKLKQLKVSAGNYLKEEDKLRRELDAQKSEDEEV